MSTQIEKQSILKSGQLRNGRRRLEANDLSAATESRQTAALDELWRSHAKKLVRTAYRITRNWEDAEDALQDSFLSAFIHFNSFDGRSRVSTWLTRIAINSALMIVRKRGSSLERSIEDFGDDAGTTKCECLSDPVGNPETHCAQREREGFLLDAIRALRPNLRQVIELQKLQELSMKETAERVGISVPATKTQVHRAKVALRESLKPKFMRKVRETHELCLLPAA